MNDHKYPLCKEICDTLAPGLFETLWDLGVYSVLHRPEFARAREYEPCCSSVFLVGDNPGGSYEGHFDGHNVVVHNGTLVASDGVYYSSVSRQYEKIWHSASRRADCFDV